MIYEVYRRPSKRPPAWLMNIGAVLICLIGVVMLAACSPQEIAGD